MFLFVLFYFRMIFIQLVWFFEQRNAVISFQKQTLFRESIQIKLLRKEMFWLVCFVHRDEFCQMEATPKRDRTIQPCANVLCAQTKQCTWCCVLVFFKFVCAYECAMCVVTMGPKKKFFLVFACCCMFSAHKHSYLSHLHLLVIFQYT